MGGSPKENQTWLLEKVGKNNICLLGLFGQSPSQKPPVGELLT